MQLKLIIIFISIIGSLLVLLLAVNPLWQNVMELRVDITRAQDDIAESEDIIKKTAEYRRIEEEVIKVVNALPSKIDTPELMDGFEKLANSNQLILESIGFSPISEVDPTAAEEGKAAFPSLILDLSLSGKYDNFIDFVCGLEKIARAMDTDTIRFTVSSYSYQPSGLSQYITFDLSIKVYYQ